jgi:ATP-binding cassette, subfamily B (MDR/TAP), member 1
MICNLYKSLKFTTLLVDREVRTGESTATNILKHFGGGQILRNASYEENFEAILKDSRAFGIGAFIGAFIQLIFAALSIDILNRTAQRQITRIRKVLLESVLRQDMTWYDLNTSENFAVKLTE